MRLALDPPLDHDAYVFTHRVRVRFAETDAQGVVHHAAYLPYLEEARVAWMRALGHPYTALQAEGLEFTVVEAFVQYRGPLRFDDLVDLHLQLGALTRATFQIGYLLTVAGEPRATAVTVHGCVTPAGRPARLPAWLADLAPDDR